MQPNADVLWSVVEENLDEAEFLWERFEAALSAADVTLEQLSRGLESRLLAHAEALVIGGKAVDERLLMPALDDKRVGPARATAVIVALLLADRAELATRALRHEAPTVSRAALRACALAAGSKLDNWIAQGLATRGPSVDRASLLELAAERGMMIPSAAESLHSSNPREIAAALRAVHRSDPMQHERRILELLEHTEPLVRDAALIASLHHGSLQGWAYCQSLALDPKEPHPLAMTLLAGLGEPGQHKRLAQQLDSDAHRSGALRAIGYSGNVGLVPLLVFHAHAKDERTVKLAGEAIATIVGDEVNALVPPKEPVSRKPGDLPPPEEDAEAKRSLPPLEEDDLDADLVPPAEEALPTLDAEAVSGWWKTARARFDVQRRYLGGAVATRGAFAKALTQFPMRRRYLLSLLLSVRTGGTARVSTRAFTATQRAQIFGITAREAEEPWTREFSLF